MSETPFKAGFVVLLGRPNAGKSTLLNAFLKFKLSIISPKPQTTRHKILGILDGENFQICFLDTPGLIEKPGDALQDALRRTARMASHQDGDVIVLLIEPEMPSAEDLAELSQLSSSQTPVILALNKIDIPAKPEKLDAVLKAYSEAVKPSACVRVSALKNQGLEQLRQEILSRLPESPPLYEQGHLSDRWERFFAAEIIREQVFALYGEEIPHATAVVIEQFRERPGQKDLVNATLYIERDGQKGIIIGEKGRTLHSLVDKSRAALENFLGRPVELEIWIKVRKNWRKDPRALKEFGYIP